MGLLTSGQDSYGNACQSCGRPSAYKICYDCAHPDDNKKSCLVALPGVLAHLARTKGWL